MKCFGGDDHGDESMAGDWPGEAGDEESDNGCMRLIERRQWEVK